MGNFLRSSRHKEEPLVWTCTDCGVATEEEAFCCNCLENEMRYIDNLQYVHQYGIK